MANGTNGNSQYFATKAQWLMNTFFMVSLSVGGYGVIKAIDNTEAIARIQAGEQLRKDIFDAQYKKVEELAAQLQATIKDLEYASNEGLKIRKDIDNLRAHLATVERKVYTHSHNGNGKRKKNK